MANAAHPPVAVVVDRPPSLPRRVLALLAPETFSEPLVLSDYAVELSRNAPLRDASAERKQETLATVRAATLARLRRLRRALVGSALSMASAVLVAYFFRVTDIAPMLPRSVLAVGSIFCFATATLGRLGWAGQSFKGDTSVEEMDQRLFHVLYWIGMCWGALAIL